MTTLGGWCQPAPGCTHTERQHVACRSLVCRCEAFGGHEKSPNQAQQSGSERFDQVESGAERRSPSRVLGGPQPGLLPPHHSTEPRSEG